MVVDEKGKLQKSLIDFVIPKRMSGKTFYIMDANAVREAAKRKLKYIVIPQEEENDDDDDDDEEERQEISPRYALFVLSIFCLVRFCLQQQQLSFGFAYGYKGAGLKAGNPYFEMP